MSIILIYVQNDYEIRFRVIRLSGRYELGFFNKKLRMETIWVTGQRQDCQLTRNYIIMPWYGILSY